MRCGSLYMRQRELKPCEVAWLDAHPARSAEWLIHRLNDGFEIHHVDGNHDNNAPGNVVLIEGVDHMRMHGMCVKALRQATGHLGGTKRAQRLSAKRRSAIARQGGRARWKKHRARMVR